jgi:hypothetical protein
MVEWLAIPFQNLKIMAYNLSPDTGSEASRRKKTTANSLRHVWHAPVCLHGLVLLTTGGFSSNFLFETSH